MISYIKGELAEILPDVIVVEANGIGYNIYVIQTSAGSKYSFSASEIKKAVPSGYWTIKLLGIKVKYGTTGTLTVNVF